MLRPWGALWAALLGCSLTVAAQKTVTVQPPVESAPLSRPSTLTVDAVVTNQGGQPITGLKPWDFTLLVDGKPTPVRSFSAYDSATAAPPESVIVLIDDVNTDPTDLMYARQQIGQFLTLHEGHLPVPVSLLLLTDSRLKQIAPPSQDGNVLNSELAKLPGLIRGMPVGGAYHAQDRMEISLRALSVLSAGESEMPGRKLVIWVSPGWWMFDNPNMLLWNQQEKAVFRTIVGVSQELRQARITLDAVDPLGTRDANAVHTYLWQSFVKPVTKWEQAQPADLALQVLAAQSGGRVLWGGNDVSKEIESCAEDARAWYALTFAVPSATEPDAWQGVTLKVNQPGAKVRTENGFYAEPAK